MLEIAQWKEELNTYRSIQRMFILEGNVTDKQILTEGIESGELVDLNEYLYIYLKTQGYHTIVFFNRIDGFYNIYDDSQQMIHDFYIQAKMKNTYTDCYERY